MAFIDVALVALVALDIDGSARSDDNQLRTENRALFSLRSKDCDLDRLFIAIGGCATIFYHLKVA